LILPPRAAFVNRRQGIRERLTCSSPRALGVGRFERRADKRVRLPQTRGGSACAP
jgi:hypothetical protein